MKSLVLLYCDNRRREVTIREFPNVTENNKHYLFGTTNWIGNREGVLKKNVGKVCKVRDFCTNCKIAEYPIEIPSLGRDISWDGGYLIFVNKNKYDENPVYYYNMLKNFRED